MQPFFIVRKKERKMKRFASVITCVAALSVAGSAAAQEPPKDPEVGIGQLALTTIPAKGGAKLTVTSPAFKHMGDIPFANTQYQGNTFPGLEWTAGPAGTKSYVIIMQDTDAMMRGGPILHWTMYNIAGTKLDAAMMAPPSGASYGPNMRGANQAYFGPRTPAGPKHRYHFQVFALDTAITADPALTYEALTAAMKDHVLASGEIIGLGQVDPNAPAPQRGGGGRGGAGGAPPPGRQ
jgi:para-nitrobenzyl esterase